jgi:transcription elongation factor
LLTAMSLSNGESNGRTPALSERSESNGLARPGYGWYDSAENPSQGTPRTRRGRGP